MYKLSKPEIKRIMKKFNSAISAISDLDHDLRNYKIIDEVLYYEKLVEARDKFMENQNIEWDYSI